jgi:hypothetical protein
MGFTRVLTAAGLTASALCFYAPSAAAQTVASLGQDGYTQCRDLVATTRQRREQPVVGFSVVTPRSGSVELTTVDDNPDDVMYIYAPASGTWQLAANDDDSGEGLRPLISHYVSGGTRYLVCIWAYGTDAGNTRLQARYTDAAPVSAPTSPGGMISDAPNSECRDLVSTTRQQREHAVAAFRVGPPRSGTLILTTRNDSPDPVMYVYSNSSSGWTLAANDDDSGEGLRPSIRLPVAGTQRYLVCLWSYGGQEGQVELLANYEDSAPASVATPSTSRRIYAGSSQSGYIDSNTETAAGTGKRHQDWLYTASGDERVVINLAGTFDPELVLYRSSGGQWQQIATDDDSGEGLDARIETTLSSGEYMICARTHGAPATGSYTLTVNRVSGSTPTIASPSPSPSTTRARVTRLTRGVAARGELGPGDSLRSDGSYLESWTFTGNAGERVRIRMISDAFAPYFQVGRVQNGRYSYISGSTTSGNTAELDMGLAESGTYMVHANSSGSGAKSGSYTIVVEAMR